MLLCSILRITLSVHRCIDHNTQHPLILVCATTMLSIISLFILLFSSSYAKTVSSLSTKDNSQRRAGCHDRSNTNFETIIFRNGSQTAFDYKIITQYKKYYPKLLEYALRVNNFEITEWRSDHRCGWQKGDSVYGQLGLDSANHRGDVY